MNKLIIIVIIIIIIVVILYLTFKSNDDKSDDDFSNIHDDTQYRKQIYNSIQQDFQPYLSKLFYDVDEINRLVNMYNNKIDQANINLIRSIYKKANEIETKINNYWYSKQFSKDFSYYIGLHYTSFLLANNIKLEQSKIVKTFVLLKDAQKSYKDKIDQLNYQYKNIKNKGAIGVELSECCKIHKQISEMKNQIAEYNNKYKERLTVQNIKTGERRDYIGNNFGGRGKRWREKILSKH